MKAIWLFPFAFLVACASQPQCGPSLEKAEKPEIFADKVNRAQLIGKWLGESKVKDGSTVKELIERHADGSYLVHFKFEGAAGARNREQVEAGLWGISGGIYFTLTRAMLEDGRLIPVDVQDAAFYDAYRAIALSPSEFTYRSLSTGEQFTGKRVGPAFRF